MRIVLLALICYTLAVLSIFNLIMYIIFLYHRYYWCVVIFGVTMWTLLSTIIRWCPFRNATCMSRVVRWLGYAVLIVFLMRFTSGLWFLGGKLDLVSSVSCFQHVLC